MLFGLDVEGILEPGKEIRERAEKHGNLGEGARNDSVPEKRKVLGDMLSRKVNGEMHLSGDKQSNRQPSCPHDRDQDLQPLFDETIWTLLTSAEILITNPHHPEFSP